VWTTLKLVQNLVKEQLTGLNFWRLYYNSRDKLGYSKDRHNLVTKVSLTKTDLKTSIIMLYRSHIMAYFPHPDCPILWSICPKADTHAQNWGYLVSFGLDQGKHMFIKSLQIIFQHPFWFCWKCVKKSVGKISHIFSKTLVQELVFKTVH
jgi:hypothetical protein